MVTKRIAVFGDVMLDRYLFGWPVKISDEAPIPVIHVSKEELRPGGAANVAANIASLGVEPILVGTVGEDGGGYCLKNALEARDVNPNWLLTDSRIKTTVKTRLMSGTAQVARYDVEHSGDNLAALNEQPWPDLIARALVDVSAVVISDYNKGFCNAALCAAIIHTAKSLNIPVLVDPKIDFHKYRGAFALTPNKKEAEKAAGVVIQNVDVAKTAAATLRKKYRIKNCVVTLGAHGMVVAGRNHVTHLPTAAQSVFDVTGAGDTVLAALAVQLANNADLLTACEYANAAAAVQVAQVGTAQVAPPDVARVLRPPSNFAANKIIQPPQLPNLLRKLRASQARIGFTNGCFDILHAGHVALLEAARARCDVLIVGINADESVTRLKGPMRPHNSLAARQAVLAGLAAVDYIVVFENDTPLELIKIIEPDVLIKGQDYATKEIVGADVVTAYGGEVYLSPLTPDQSSTRVLEKISKSAS